MSAEKNFNDLFTKYRVKTLVELQKKIEGKSGANKDRDLFYGGIFVNGVSQVQKHQCMLRSSDNEPWDIEMIDNTLLQRKEVPNHFYIQNVHITHHYIKSQVNNGLSDIYNIFSKFLYEKKLCPEKADYRGGILVFHIGATIQGFFDINILRERVRGISQNKFEQIWVTCFTNFDYSLSLLTELLKDNGELLQFSNKLFTGLRPGY